MPGHFIYKEIWPMSQHIIDLKTEKHGDIEVMIGFDPPLREFFGAAQTSEDGVLYHSSPREDLPSIKAAILKELGVDLPATMVAGAEQDYRDFVAGKKDVGRRVVVYDASGAVTNRISA